MRTKILLTSSAIFMAVLGMLSTFMPQEILEYYGSYREGEKFVVPAVQIAGALYLGFAILNWTARASLIGGIYNRPIALGNFLHFAMIALVLLKELKSNHGVEIVAGALIYSAFAVWFGLVLFARARQTGK
ncbi:hypothetical protein [Cohnella cholangitidis]|uniref:Uncharacterized protein n=1 Tax=Cohnella cholangitidis TaxID=2598458 RepID=A0A7G5BYJ5_9BACL|nr:hypothetical protein [Cohnella cholangitidis]QMV42029.1 hypothetical protein FPL14_13105 [Cohnella cholangitidis]